MTVKVGIVGTGGFSHHHAKILSAMEGVHVVSTAGTSEEKAVNMASQFNHAKGFGKIDDMLDADELDAVYICVPPMAHGEIESKLIDRGIPFFVEKPLGIDKNTTEKILSSIQKKSLITSVGYHFRYSDTVQQLKKLCSEQQIGMALGQWMDSLPPVSWWKRQELSGGQLHEQTTHIVDLFRYLFGEVQEVYGVYENRFFEQKRYIDDSSRCRDGNDEIQKWISY
jgi:myo-inositol 2-dehydrogenase/D-chiro-inositol 1-dehydrogenase